ncbi:MAG: hypothetical protein M3P08_02420 [Thermoproteota archaeon]|nr:hypothetical protein [Thermoproteota archaeon]
MERGLGQGSIINYRHVLKHFYDMNDIILNWNKLAKFTRREEVRKKDRAYTREEIQKMLGVSDLKSRAIILLFASSFVRLGGIAGLVVGNLMKTNDLYQIVVYAGSNDEYTTFCTPECTKVIDSYLESRIRCGEIISDESPLFRRKFDTDDPLKAKNNVKAVGIEGISFLVKQAIIKSGIHAQVKGQVKRNHGFRKWGDTTMIRKAINVVDKETLLGHGTGLDDKYYRPTDTELLEEYQKAVDNLTINEENRLKTKVQTLEKDQARIGILEKQMQTLISTINQMGEEGYVGVDEIDWVIEQKKLDKIPKYADLTNGVRTQ